ncbi:MAG: hypothetical protein AVO39_05140 [delta proteobacterium MLS_D]|nr:MAG: hypothetical protein AVO39_05140 [delta proteobacterium MLS_D]
MNLGIYIARSARFYPSLIALACRDRRYSYTEFESRTNRLAQGLIGLGMPKGTHVAVQAWNRTEIVETEVACYKGGFVRVPVNARLSTAETVYVLKNSETRVLVADSAHMAPVLENLESLPSLECLLCIDRMPGNTLYYEDFLEQSIDAFPDREVQEDELAVLAYSSGTTGKLKAVMQSYGNRMAMIRKAFMIPGVSIEPGDVFAHVGPVTHASGMLLMPVMYSGGCNVILDRFDVETLLQTIEREKVNYLFMVPAMINAVINHPRVAAYDTDSLKGIFYGAAPMSENNIRRALELFGPILVQGYGMTETTSFTTILTARDHVEGLRDKTGNRLLSCGRPIFETEIRLVDEQGNRVATGETGEIIARGPDVMKGYYKDSELTERTIINGWIHSGDMAREDEQGYIYIVDRKSETVISGGFNVYPSEVEQVLSSHPAVAEVCVIGVPDDKWGEAVKALVVLKKGTSATQEELIEHCRKFLARYKKPGSVDFVDSLPKNPNGKIARRAIKEHYWTGHARRVH